MTGIPGVIYPGNAVGSGASNIGLAEIVAFEQQNGVVGSREGEAAAHVAATDVLAKKTAFAPLRCSVASLEPQGRR